MAKIFVYDEESNRMESYNLAESDPMPYNIGDTLKVREFRGSSGSSVLWTTVRAMEAFNITREAWGKAIYVGYAFKRFWEGGHGKQSQHYAGVAFDCGQTTTSAQRNQLRSLAEKLGVWGYVEPGSLTPTWVHLDRRYFRPACSGTAGYPTLKNGSVSTYVLILQDGLNALGFSTGSLDGKFGANTEAATKRFQSRYNLTADGVIGCNSWKKLADLVVGKGRTSTVID